jgi:hypothetical protein
MRPGDLTSGAAKLGKAWSKLRARWDATKLEWHDQVSEQFEQKYLDRLEPQIVATLERMRALAAAATAARNDCER